MSHFVYILRCRDGSLYTGYTTDVERRVSEHNSSDLGAKFTRSRRPCSLVYTEEFQTRSEAMSREYHIKHKLSKQEKEALISAYSS
ncbi:MAG: GIY-YIG nuclease family protein [Lachnospiraceae bacterium]|nr:GIY-YIG nuclease family protein [Lachnospiraceae bacterium]